MISNPETPDLERTPGRIEAPSVPLSCRLSRAAPRTAGECCRRPESFPGKGIWRKHGFSAFPGMRQKLIVEGDLSDYVRENWDQHTALLRDYNVPEDPKAAVEVYFEHVDSEHLFWVELEVDTDKGARPEMDKQILFSYLREGNKLYEIASSLDWLLEKTDELLQFVKCGNPLPTRLTDVLREAAESVNHAVGRKMKE